MNSRIASILLAATCTIATIPAPAQTTTPTTNATDEAGPLRVHVTAVQGGAQFRPDPQTKWQTLKPDVDLTEGVEIRTGPKGSVQFIVGVDQVFRVDRLTTFKLLRAALLPDGTIKTDVGMQYGRVSKDVDAAQHPHLDTIVTPSSTLAVRGTRVSLYDQPPYAPEAVSLTGAAVYTNIHGLLVQFGAKGGGTVKLDSSSSSAADYALKSEPVDPKGTFSAQTVDEQIIANLPGLSGAGLGVFSSIESQIASGQTIAGFTVGGLGELRDVLQFPIIWNNSGTSAFTTMVDLSIKDPAGMVYTLNNVPSLDNAKGPRPGASHGYAGSNVSNSNGFGQQEIDFFSPIFSGLYTITVSIDHQTLQQHPTAQIVAGVGVFEMIPNDTENPPTQFSSGIVLNATTPTAQFTTTVTATGLFPSGTLQRINFNSGGTTGTNGTGGTTAPLVARPVAPAAAHVTAPHVTAAPVAPAIIRPRGSLGH